MQLYVKRNQFKSLVAAKIEIQDVNEWTLLSFGLEKLLEDTNDTIAFYTQLQNQNSENHSDKIQDSLERKLKLEEMLRVLDPKNELKW